MECTNGIETLDRLNVDEATRTVSDCNTTIIHRIGHFQSIKPTFCRYFCLLLVIKLTFFLPICFQTNT